MDRKKSNKQSRIENTDGQHQEIDQIPEVEDHLVQLDNQRNVADTVASELAKHSRSRSCSQISVGAAS